MARTSRTPPFSVRRPSPPRDHGVCRSPWCRGRAGGRRRGRAPGRRGSRGRRRGRGCRRGTDGRGSAAPAAPGGCPAAARSGRSGGSTRASARPSRPTRAAQRSLRKRSCVSGKSAGRTGSKKASPSAAWVVLGPEVGGCHDPAICGLRRLRQGAWNLSPRGAFVVVTRAMPLDERTLMNSTFGRNSPVRRKLLTAVSAAALSVALMSAAPVMSQEQQLSDSAHAGMAMLGIDTTGVMMTDGSGGADRERAGSSDTDEITKRAAINRSWGRGTPATASRRRPAPVLGRRRICGARDRRAEVDMLTLNQLARSRT